MEKQKLKRKILTIEDKVKIITEIEKGRKIADLCQELSMASSTICSVLKMRSKIKHAYNNNGLNMKRLRKPLRSDVDEALREWYMEEKRNRGITLKILRNKAGELAKRFGYEEHACIGGWLDRFRVRHGIFVAQNGELIDQPIKLLSINRTNNYNEVNRLNNFSNEDLEEHPMNYTFTDLQTKRYDEENLSFNNSNNECGSDFYKEETEEQATPYLVKQEPPMSVYSLDSDQYDSSVMKISEENLNVNQCAMTPIELEDQFSIFGKSVAIQLRQMNLSKALTLQAKIQILLSEERVKELAEN